MKRTFGTGIVLGLVVGLGWGMSHNWSADAAEHPGEAAGEHPGKALEGSGTVKSVRKFTVIGTSSKGAKRWEPATLICFQGEKIKIKLINKIPPRDNVHGFSIEAFGVKTEVSGKKDKTVEFVAKRAGLFDITCHLHPAHIGGQLLVLEK